MQHASSQMERSQSKLSGSFAESNGIQNGVGRPISSAIKRILGFFGLVAMVALILQMVINSGLRRIQSSEFGAINKAMQGKVNAEIVINGSSRASAHYDPRVLQGFTGKSAYNLGRNGSQVDMQLAILKAYLNHNVKPEVVIQNLDLFSFVSTREGEVYQPALYMPYLDNDEIYQALRQINPDAWKWKYIPLYGYSVVDMRFTWIAGIKGFFGWNPREDFHLGFNPRDAVWTGDFEHYREQNPDGVKFEIEAAGIKSLEELIQLCISRHIAVILVYSPEYYEMQELEINRPEILAKFHEISMRYGVPFWDYSDSALSHRREFFQNSQHLNTQGAAAFSEECAKRLASERFPSNPVAFGYERPGK